MNQEYTEVMANTPEMSVYARDPLHVVSELSEMRISEHFSKMSDGILHGRLPEYNLATDAIMDLYRISHAEGYVENDPVGLQLNAAALYLDSWLAENGAYEALSEKDVRYTSQYQEPLRLAANPPRPEFKSLNPNMRKISPRVKKFFQEGLTLKENGSYPALEWYEGVLEWFADLLGDRQKGLMFALFLAATSPQERVIGNLSLATQCYQYWEAGKLPPKAITGTSKGLMDAHYHNVVRVINGQPLSGPKIHCFVENLKGDRRKVTVDTWMIKALGADGDEGLNLLGFPEEPGYIVKYVDQRNRTRSIGAFAKTFKETSEEVSFKSAKGKKISIPRKDIISTKDAMIPKTDLGSATPAQKKRGELPRRYAELASIVQWAAHKTQDPRTGSTPTPPRDYQASSWTGIKLVQDPIGVRDFRYYYEEALGKTPPPSLEVFGKDVPSFSKVWPPPTVKMGLGLDRKEQSVLELTIEPLED